MKVRRRTGMAISGGLASAVAIAGLAATPAAAGVAAPKAVVPTPPPACSADITGLGSVPGDYDGRNLQFSYTLGGAACLNGTYSLLIRNNYNPNQWWLFIKRGDGKSKEIVFNQPLPWTPTDPVPNDSGKLGVGLCVQGITTQGLRVVDVAPDPQEASCEPLRGGGARAFH